MRKKLKSILRTKKTMIILDILINVCILFLFVFITMTVGDGFNIFFFIADALFLLMLYILLSRIKYNNVRWIAKSIIYTMLLFMPYADLISYNYYTQVFRYYEIKNIGVLFRTFQIGFKIPIIQIVITLIIMAAIYMYVYTQILNKKERIKFKIRNVGISGIILVTLIPFILTISTILTVQKDDNYFSTKKFLVKEVYSNEVYIKTFGYSQYRIRKLFPTFKSSVSSKEELDKYFNNKNSKEVNEYSGKYEGYNVIHLILESLDTKAFNEYSMPNLYGMYEDSIIVDDFYVPEYQQGATCNSEFMVNTSVYPISLNNTTNIMCKLVYTDSFSYSLPRQMIELGYNTHYFHNGTADFYNRDQVITNTYGFENARFAKESQLDRDVTDIELMEFFNEIDYTSKFFTQVLTYSMHVGGYTYTEEEKNYLIENIGEIDSKFYIDYLSKQMKTDELIGKILDKLKEQNVLDKTLLIVSSDHYPYGFPGDNIDYMDTIGYKYNHVNDIHKQSLIIYDGGMTKAKHKIPSSTIDIAPTILNMVSSLDDTVVYNYYFGKDIFDYQSIPMFSNYDIYYKDDYYGFDYRYNGIHNLTEVEAVFFENYHLRLLSDYAIKTKYKPLFK